MEDAAVIIMDKAVPVEKPAQTRASLIKELTLVYMQMSAMKPPRAKDGGITIAQQRHWQSKLDWCKARVYCLSSIFPIMREDELKTLEADIRAIQELIENDR